jgi:hypothetical protein
MHTRLKKLLNQHQTSGQLALAANLLYDAVFVGWIAFAGLYAIEVLLPTFVMARLSLVKFAILLLVFTSLLAWIGQWLKRGADASDTRMFRPAIIFVIIAGLGIVALAHYRFPWWSIPLSVGGYALTAYLFWKLLKAK